MKTNPNIPYYLTTIGLFILLKFGYTCADNSDLAFLLKPSDSLIGLITGSHSVLQPDNSYYLPQLNILIDKSCSATNHWILVKMPNG